VNPGEWKDLALRLQAGDAASEDELARLFHPHFLAMAASRLNDRETAREIAQEAIMGVLSALRMGRCGNRRDFPGVCGWDRTKPDQQLFERKGPASGARYSWT
jgi:hypothetical protein